MDPEVLCGWHGWWSTALSCGQLLARCAKLCQAASCCAHPPRLRQSSQGPIPATRRAHTAL